MGKRISFAQDTEGELYIIGATSSEFPVWEKYLSLNEDYTSFNNSLTASMKDGKDKEVTLAAIESSRGIRILKQDRWEALCSFIISQNNNIPRIKKIISAMCEKYGRPIENGYDFPSAEALMNAGEDGIFALRTGFRAKYIYDAAKRVSEDTAFLDAVACAESYETAEKLLSAVKGVGPKVAACTLLFGFGRYDAFPVDVWIKRVLQRHYSEGFDHRIFGEYAGIAQQYLFYYERYLGGS